MKITILDKTPDELIELLKELRVQKKLNLNVVFYLKDSYNALGKKGYFNKSGTEGLIPGVVIDGNDQSKKDSFVFFLKGSFDPNPNNGQLYREANPFLIKGLMDADEFTDGIVEQNQSGRNPDVTVRLLDDNNQPFIKLTADQAAKAKGVVFITDKKDGERLKAEDKGKNRFFVKEFTTYSDDTISMVFVYDGFAEEDGSLTFCNNEMFQQKLQDTFMKE